MVGKEQTFWLQVGDGAIVFARGGGSLEVAGPVPQTEGANSVILLRHATVLPCGLVPPGERAGIAACSDGSGECLISTDCQRVASVIGRLLQDLREQRLSTLDVCAIPTTGGG